MTEEQKAQALGAWLSGPLGAPPPEGMDPEVVEAVYALHPHRAPAARVTADDILASLTAGPLARAENLAEDPDSGPLAEVVPFPKRPEPRPEAQVVVADEPAANTPMRRRWFGPQIMGAIGVAAGLLLAARVGWVALEGQPGPATMAEDLPGLTAPSEVLQGAPSLGSADRSAAGTAPSPAADPEEPKAALEEKVVAGLEAPTRPKGEAAPKADENDDAAPPPPPVGGVVKEMTRAQGPAVDADERQIPQDQSVDLAKNERAAQEKGSAAYREGNVIEAAPVVDGVTGGEALNLDDVQATTVTGAANGAGAGAIEGWFGDSRKSADKAQPPEVAAEPPPPTPVKDSAGAKAKPVAQKPSKSPAAPPAPAAAPAPTPTLADPRSSAQEESKKRLKEVESAEAEEIATLTQGDTLYRSRDASNVGEGRYDGLTRASAVPTDYYAVLAGYDAETQGQVDAAMAAAQAKMMAGDPSGAAQALLTASTGQTQAGQSLAILAAQRYLGLGDFKKAKAAAQKGLSLSSANSPERSQLYLLYGDALQALGDEAGARRAWNDAAALNKGRMRYDDAQPMRMEDADHK